jgi:hypothetical protein
MVKDLEAQYFPYEWDGKKMAVQLAMRPIQLWEIVFPKECYEEVYRTLNTQMVTGARNDWDNRINKRLFALRKLLKANKLPTVPTEGPKRLIYNQNIAIYPIGIKEDNVENGNERL